VSDMTEPEPIADSLKQNDPPTKVEPVSKVEPDRGDGFIGAFKAQQAEVATVRAEAAKHVKRIAELERVLAERDGTVVELNGQIDKLDKQGREQALFGKVRAKLPHIDEVVIEGLLSTWHTKGKIDKHAVDDKRDAEVEKVLALMKSEASRLAEPPAGVGGGNNGVPLKPEKPAGASQSIHQVRWR
jgi:uncharacterized coiled-coil protein SlyX